MSPKFVPFDLERWQSTWENRVRFNLSESGVHPLSVQELLGLAAASAVPLLEVRLGYAQSNGSDLLRERIAALYPGASPDQVLVTTGSSEANFVTCWRLLEPGDKVAVMMPNYLQTWGLAQNFGAQAKAFQLHEKEGWEPYAEEIRTAIAPGTKLVVVTNPHNPTGHVLGDAARKTILDRAAEVGAWILVDEVYQGAERGGKTTQSFWGRRRTACRASASAGSSQRPRSARRHGPGTTTRRSAHRARRITSPPWPWTRTCARNSSTAPAASCTRTFP